MASEVIEEIKTCIDAKKDFLLSGGAGSGKTHTLVETINYIYSKNKNARVACITFTKVAAEEIKSRTNSEKLFVSTIHQFLWDSIKSYQHNIKETLLSLINKDGEDSIKTESEISADTFKKGDIQYKEYRKLSEGIVSHNEVITLSKVMFEKFKLLRNVLKDKYQYILIDEYQDTQEKVIKIVLDFLKNETTKNNVIGFYGDSMQAIYDWGIGDIHNYVRESKVIEIIKQDNYRCSISVIDFLNKIRGDQVIQKPSNKDANGEILNKLGSVKFLYSDKKDIDYSDLKNHSIFSDWDFYDPSQTKELYLTHNMIAKTNGFYDLNSGFKGHENLIGEKKNKIAIHLFKIQKMLSLYAERRYNEFMNATEFKIKKLSDKAKLKEKIESLSSNLQTIENVIDLADSYSLIKKDDNFNEFINGEDGSKIYKNIKDLKWDIYVKAFDYEENKAAYSTQHGIKGAEFENVLVILDNGNWNQYNFSNYLGGRNMNEAVKNRTHKLLYVACSRSKNNLVLFCQGINEDLLQSMINLVGSENCVNFDI